MSLRIVKIIFFKELLDILRDKRALVVALGIPLILYPLLIIISGQVFIIRAATERDRDYKVALASGSDPLIGEWLREIPRVKVTESSDPPGDLSAGKIHAFVSGPGNVETTLREGGTVGIDVSFDLKRISSAMAADAIDDGLSAFKDDLVEDRLALNNLDRAFAEPIEVRKQMTTPIAKIRGYLLAAALSLAVISMVAMSALYPAMDLTAGEKERGTFETLLSAPISKVEIVCGKFLTVFAITLVVVILNIGSIAASGLLILWQAARYGMGAEGLRKLVDVSPGTVASSLLVFGIVMVPLLFLLCAVTMSCAVLARNYKEANYYLLPVVILFTYPAIAAVFPGVELTRFTQFVPVTNLALLAKKLLMGEASFGAIFAVFFSTAMYAILALVAAVWLFQREDVVLSEEKGLPLTWRRKFFVPRTAATAGLSLSLYALTVLLLFYVALPLQARWTIPGLLITEWLLILLPSVLILWYARVDLRKALSLRRPSLGTMLGIPFLVFGSGVCILQILVWQERILPFPEEWVEQMKKVMSAEGSTSQLWMLLLTIAVSPAICEEILFRGAILSGLRTKLSPVATVCVIGALFGLIHMNAWRLIPTGLLGLVLTYVVMRSGSIFPGMLFHFLINGSAVLISNTITEEGTEVSTALEQFSEQGMPLWLLALGAMAFVFGIWITEKTAQRPFAELPMNNEKRCE